MYRNRKKAIAFCKLEFLATLGLTLGLSSWALGQDCGAGDFVSAEACLVDGDTDTVNGGCNSDTPFPFEPGVIGQSITGTVSTYVVAGDCPADLNGDGTVNTSDLLALFAEWGINPGSPADLNGDGVVNTSDLLALFAEWGPCPLDTNRRDTDWYLVSQKDLMAADLDGNGVIVVSHTGTSEVPVVLFIVAIGGPNSCDSISVIGDTGFAGDAANTHCIEGEASRAVINIADHPNGIVYYIAPGTPAGGTITTGYPCSDPPHDYNITLEVSELNTACTFEGETCNVSTPGVPGCNDPECCDLVCTDFDPGCCDFQWDDFCVEFATNEDFAGCALGIGAPAFIATGSDDSVDGYLDLFVDGFGSASQAAGGPLWIDHYNPVGHPLGNPTWANTTMLFTGATDKVALSLHEGTLFYYSGSTMTATFTGPSVLSDQNSDGVDDQIVSNFSVSGALDLDVVLTQNVVSSLLTEGGTPFANWTISYEITNNGSAATFDILRWTDADILYGSNDFADDTVGTGTNGGSKCDRYLFQGEVGDSGATLASSTNQSNALYVGSKRFYDLDCDGPAPPFDFGIDPDPVWSNNGLPVEYENYVAGVGYEFDGESGASPDDGCVPANIGADASMGIQSSISLGAGETTTVIFVLTYGATTPNGVVCQP